MPRGLEIVLDDYSATPNTAGYAAAVPDGLIAMHFFGGSLARSLVNRAPGGPDASVTGAPVVNAASLLLTSGTNFITLGVRDAPTQEWVFVAKGANQSLVSVPMSSRVSTVSGAQITFPTDVLDATLQMQETDGSSFFTNSNTLNNLVDTNDWAMFIAGWDATASHIYDMTHYPTGQLDSVTGGRTWSTNTNAFVRAGGAQSGSSFVGDTEMAMVAVYDHILTLGERTAIYAQIQDQMAAAGITI